DAADRGCLHVRVALAEDDVVDDVGVEAGALQQGGDDLAAELLRRDVLELAAEGAHGGAQRLADDDVVRGCGGLGHSVSLEGVVVVDVLTDVEADAAACAAVVGVGAAGVGTAAAAAARTSRSAGAGSPARWAR